MLAKKDESVARRLRTLQAYAISQGYAENQTQMAEHLGISEPRWTQMLNSRDLSKEVAFKIVEKFPEVTLEWLWLGKTEGLRLQTLRELEAAAKNL